MCLGLSVQPNGVFEEDCLFVNVWAPTNATEDMKLPVMVFIPGGGKRSTGP
jgi:carboxylesterase type B